MSAPLIVEPARYGHTGICIGVHLVRSEFHAEAMAYALDAPAFIPRGSARGAYVPANRFEPQGYHYISSTELRT